MIRSRAREAKRGSSGFNIPGVPFPVDFAFDFLTSANPIYPAGLTTTTTIDSDGTFVNSSGLITQKTSNVWPLDYSPSTLLPLGRPVWEARTNLLIQTVLPGGGAAPTGWTQTVGTGTSAPTASIYGNGDGAVAYVQTGAAERPFFAQTSPSLSTSTTYQIWMYVEAVSGTIIAANALALNSVPAGSTVTYPVCSANPAGGSSGTVTTGQLVVQIAVAGTAGTVIVRAGLGASSNSTGSLTFSRPQLEAGNFPTPYIPTAGTSVTRSADACSIALPAGFNASEGTFVAEWINGSPSGAVKIIAGADNGTTSELFQFYLNAAGRSFLFVADGGATQANIDSLITPSQNSISRAAAAYRVNDFALSTNGAATQTDSNGTVPSPTTLSLGIQAGLTGALLNGWLRKLYYSRVRQPNGALVRASR